MQSNQDRSDSVMAAVVRAYVGSARPVPSQSIAEELHLSSATIRNVFAGLEQQGFLAHPHTSAGRVPTEQGYRLYVDRLMAARELSRRELLAIEERYRAKRLEVESLIRHTAGLLSAMTRLAGVAAAPASTDFHLGRFQLVHLSERQVLVVLVTDEGPFREERVRLLEPLAHREMDRVLEVLNQRFAGRSLLEIRARLLQEVEESRRLRLSLVQAALDLIDHTLRLTEDSVYVEGASRLADQPEFRDASRMGPVLRSLEERQPLARLLGRQWDLPGVKVGIGRELGEASLADCAVVQVPYRIRGRVVGALAVLGPTRMPYEHVTATLERVSRILEERLSEEGGSFS
jgi:heat-inducible transcriptional repressor